MPNVESYIRITDNAGNVIPSLSISLKDGVNVYDCTYLNGKYYYDAPSGIYDVYNNSEAIIIIPNFYVVPHLVKREWWIESMVLTDGTSYTFGTMQDNYGEFLPITITDPKIIVANQIGTRGISFEDITSTGFKVKLGDSGTPVTTTADLYIKELLV